MALYCAKQDGVEIDDALYRVGHSLLLRFDYKKTGDVREYRIKEAIRDSYRGEEGPRRAVELCRHLKRLIAERKVYVFELDYAFDALFEVQPLTALDELLRDGSTADEDGILGSISFNRRSPLDNVEGELLWTWADQDPVARYPLISRSLNIFAGKEFEQDDGLSQKFLVGLERAPDKTAFLGADSYRLRPNGWSGNLSIILDRRREFLEPLTVHTDQEVRTWANEQVATLRRWADNEREQESEREETFE
jgi:hypothetical protein